MKIIHLTDTHLLPKGGVRSNIDPKRMLKLALKSIEKNHADALFVVITGDLANNAEHESYIILKDLLSSFSLTTHLILGNHDKKEVFNMVFSKCKDSKFMQYSLHVEDRVFLFLDSTIEEQVYGSLCETRLLWLERELSAWQDRDVYIFMHHFPLNSKLPWLDKNACFIDKSDFWRVVLRYNNVKHIFTGHMHRVINMSFKGVGISCTKSTNVQAAYTPNSDEEFSTTQEKPTYGIVYLEEDSVLIHNHEYLSEDLVCLSDEKHKEILE